MGCNETKDITFPKILLFFEFGDETQKEYCLKVKDNFKYQSAVSYSIFSQAEVPFSIQLKLKGESQPIKIQENKDFSDKAMNESIAKICKILEENGK